MAMNDGVTEELFGAYHFLLEITGITQDSKTIVGGFKSVSGMDSETEIIEFKQGTLKYRSHATPIYDHESSGLSYVGLKKQHEKLKIKYEKLRQKLDV